MATSVPKLQLSPPKSEIELLSYSLFQFRNGFSTSVCVFSFSVFVDFEVKEDTTPVSE